MERLASFVLSKEEDDTVVVSEDDMKVSKQECDKSIMGKILTYKGVHLGGLKAAMEISWGFPKGLKVQEVGGGIYHFVFANKMDLIRVLTGEPMVIQQPTHYSAALGRRCQT